MADDKGKQKSLAKIETEYTRRHNRHLDKYQRQIAAVYKAAAQDAARIGIRFDAPTDRIFSFKDYPGANRQIKSLLKRMSRDIRAIVQGGIDAEWQLANDKLDDTVALALGFNLTGEQMRRYYNSNSEALAAFRQRKASGMSLSERVWNLTEQFKSELELALDGGIRDGLSADEMSRQIRQYLNNPDKLFRRVRDEHGILQLSRRAAAFHPGQGVYRSSYKNARRLAGTETNIAYRLADHLRLQQLDFVVGIKVVLSNNHTTTNSKGETVELHDICDELAGNYPKTFVFTGWHPNCRCHTETILLTAEERKMRRQGIYNPNRSSRYVATPPENFTSWVQDNASRIAAAQQRGTLPYFVRDNRKAVNSILKNADTGIHVAAVERTLNVRPVKQPLSQATKDRRKVIRQLAVETLVGKQFPLPQIGGAATISSHAIKEWLNQPFGNEDNIKAKNEALLNLPRLIKNSVYRGSGVDKHMTTATLHLFETEIGSRKCWIIIREFHDRTCLVWSITDKEAILDMVH